MPSLPTTRPQWYGLKDNEERGWTPLTSDIVDKPENKDIVHAWSIDKSKAYKIPTSQKTTLKLDRLRVLSPIQVGGNIMPEGNILPAQIGGIPCIPGSSVRGALLHWLRKQWTQIPAEEQQFWQSLMLPERLGWQPRAIRFEIIWLDNLRPYPLNAQQPWQIFNEATRALSVQWQISPKYPPSGSDRFSLSMSLKRTATDSEKQWLQHRLEEMLLQQGIGRGTRSGFGRLGKSIPDGQWEITLTGMKPAVSSHSNQQRGEYRWSPQVLRANLRGLFHRLALSQLSSGDAQSLTDKIFGSFNGPAQLTLTSYLHSTPRQFSGTSPSPSSRGAHNNNKYANIPQEITNSNWLIKADCNEDFHPLISHLLALASRIGGLGPGWRRPPHEIRNNCYRGSEFTVTGLNQDNEADVITTLSQAITLVANLAVQKGFNLARPQPALPLGCIQSIWQGGHDQWKDIVHGVCSTNASNRPVWCGDTTRRPSGYAVRRYEDKSLITVFDPAVTASLRAKDFTQIWSA